MKIYATCQIKFVAFTIWQTEAKTCLKRKVVIWKMAASTQVIMSFNILALISSSCYQNRYLSTVSNSAKGCHTVYSRSI